MDLKQTMAELKKLGSEQTRKVMANHGAGANQFGVKFGDMYKLQKKIKTNQQLANQLWKTENSDARILALLIADPETFTIQQAESWCQDITFFMHSNYLGDLITKTEFTNQFINKHYNSDQEFFLNAAYSTLSSTLKNNAQKLTDTDCKKYLKYIQKNIHHKPNRGRSAMNWALIAIGTYKDTLAKDAMQVAKDVGKVEIDHGTTNCKTPFAPDYIKKARAHRAKKKS